MYPAPFCTRMHGKPTRSYRTSNDGLVIYDAEEPRAYVASSVCVGLEESA